MQLQLTDGTTTLTLSGSSDYYGVRYFPSSMSLREAERPGATITETVELIIKSSTASDAADAVSAVERLLAAARRRQRTASGAKVYANYQAYTGASTGRSEILDGEVAGDEIPAARQPDAGAMRVWVTWTRMPYWEGSEATLFSGQGLTNASGSNTYYSSATVSGLLPTPAKIELTNNSGGTQYQRFVCLGVNAFNDPATWNGTLGSKTLTDSAPFTWSTEQASYTLTDAQLAAMQGDPQRLIGAFSAAGNAPNIWWKWQQRFGSNWLAETTPIFPPDIGVMDFGVMRIPVGGYDTASSGIDLQLRCQSDSISLYGSMNFLQIFPATPGAFQKINLTGNLAAGDVLVVDNIEERAYVNDSGDHMPIAYPDGHGLLLHPGEAHRFIWLLRTTAGRTGSETCTLTVKYRPRWLTVI